MERNLNQQTTLSVDLANIDNIIKMNKIEEITDPIFVNMNKLPTVNGLFSYRIFGLPGSMQRKTNWGYIDLKGRYLHPLMHNIIGSVQRNLLECINGQKKFSVSPKGHLEPDENGGTGVRFLYDVWGKFKFKVIADADGEETNLRKERVGLLNKLTRDEIFVDKWLVIPPFYRDLNWNKLSQGVLSKDDESNDLYSKLINLAMSNEKETMSFLDHYSVTRDNAIQNTLNALFELFSDKLYKKDGMIKKNLLGKVVDFSTRSVISANRYNEPNYKHMKVDVEHMGIPIAQAVSLYQPFIVKELYSFFLTHLSTYQDFKIGGKKVQQDPIEPPMYQNIFGILGEPSKSTIKTNRIKIHKDAYREFLPEKLKKILDRFIKDPKFRNEPITILDEDRNQVVLPLYKTFFPDRDFTWLDLIYITLDSIIHGKVVLVSRYPMDTFQNMVPSKISILTTAKTERREFIGKVFEHYPVIYPKSKNKFVEYIDTIRLSNVYLARMGADFDGDTVVVRPLFTEEANEEGRALIRSKKNLLSPNGSQLLVVEKEAALAIFHLTR